MMPDPSSDQQRIQVTHKAVRVLPVNPDGAVLLLRCIDPAEPQRPFWATLGVASKTASPRAMRRHASYGKRRE